MSQQCTKCGFPFGEGYEWNPECTRCANAKRLTELCKCEVPTFQQGKDRENQEKLLVFLSRCALQREALSAMISQIAQMETRVRDTFWNMPKNFVFPVEQIEESYRPQVAEEREHIIEINQDGNPVYVIDSVEHSGDADLLERDIAQSDEGHIETPRHRQQTQEVLFSDEEDESPPSVAETEEELWERPQPLLKRTRSIYEQMSQDPFSSYSADRLNSNSVEQSRNSAHDPSDFNQLILGIKEK